MLAKSSSDIEQFKEQLHESSNIIIEKENMKWQTGFEELQLVVDKLQLRPGKWINPGGYSKLFENVEVAIRWYSNSKTLTVKGEKAEEIKEKLLYFDLKLGSESIVYPLSPKNSNHEITYMNNYVHESPDLHTQSRCSEMLATNDPSSDVNRNKMDHLPEMKAINSKLEEHFMQNVNTSSMLYQKKFQQ